MSVRTTLLGWSGSGRSGGTGGVPALLVAELLDSLSNLAVAVEEIQRHPGGLGEPAEGDRLVAADHLPDALLGAGRGGDGLGGGGATKVVGIASTHDPFRSHACSR